jgi:hypothetical protein
VWVLASVAIALLSWHALELQPMPGLDNSWEAGLHMALHYRITFGNELIFTYGPLGFLSVPTFWYAGTGSIAFVYTILLRITLAAALFAGARRSYGAVIGLAVALIVACASMVSLETVPFFVFSVLIIDSALSRNQTVTLLILGGAMAGIQLLNKESTGVEIMVMALILACAVRGHRLTNLAIVLGALSVALLAGWTVTGQEWGALPAYVENAERIISGYAAAMSLEQTGLGWEYMLGWVAFAIGLAGAMQMGLNRTARQRWGIVALWVAFSFLEYKEGFVRHEIAHATIYFVALMGGFLAFRWSPGSRLVGICLLAALFAFVASVQGVPFSTLFQPEEAAKSAISQVGDLLSESKRNAIIEQGRYLIQTEYPLDAETLSLLRGHTVDVEPYEMAVAWAYNLDWHPLPVFQTYSAYTTGLDEADAAVVNSAMAPQRILRNSDPGIDGRAPPFDESYTTRAILCRYQELHTGNGWQVLGVGPERCQAPVLLDTVHAGWNQRVSVPAPPNQQSFVFVRIGGVAPSGFERLEALLYKPAIRVVLLEGSSFRLVEGTATDGLVLRASAGVDFKSPYEVAPNTSTIAVGKAGQHGHGGEPITFSFYSQSVTAGPSGSPSQREPGA